MAISAAAKNITKVALCTGAIYYSIVEGVWSTSDQSVGPMSKVKQRLLPQAFQFVNNLPYTLSSSWNHCVSVTFKTLKHCECSYCRVQKFFKSFWD
ncbi:hypothetical protein AHF37_09791 [Paragonimus kellicotti]|nr:hypothetical protein AHF37_09791 [Paragonimus kellicotti]